MRAKKRKKFLVGGLILALLIFGVVFIVTREADPVENGEDNGEVVENGEEFECGNVLSYQDEEYETVEMDGDCWLGEDLRATEYQDGEEIPNIVDNESWNEAEEGAYACYNNIEENCEDGAYYNWGAIDNPSGLCPEGWSVPTDEEWTDLERAACQELGNTGCEEEFPYEGPMTWRGTDEGEYLKSDDSGFNARLDGFRNPGGPYTAMDERGFWWTSSETEDFAIARSLTEGIDEIRRIETSPTSGMRIRCLQN